MLCIVAVSTTGLITRLRARGWLRRTSCSGRRRLSLLESLLRRHGARCRLVVRLRRRHAVSRGRHVVVHVSGAFVALLFTFFGRLGLARADAFDMGCLRQARARKLGALAILVSTADEAHPRSLRVVRLHMGRRRQWARVQPGAGRAGVGQRAMYWRLLCRRAMERRGGCCCCQHTDIAGALRRKTR